MSELILAPDELIEKWNNLTLANNFLFTKVMQNEEICKHTLELLLNIKIKKLEYTHSEVYFKDSYDSRGIRFDVYTSDDGHCYDIEMQTTNKSNLLKRARYYSSCIDIDTLKSGKDFSELKENIIIFLCLEDPFKEQLPVYTFKTKCLECPGLSDDETTKVFYNINQLEKNTNKAVRTFFQYIKTNIPSDSFTQTLSKYTAEAKQNADYRRQYLRLEVELSDKFHEGIAQGIEQGIEQGVEKGRLQSAVIAVKQLNVTPEMAAEKFNIPLSKLQTALNH